MQGNYICKIPSFEEMNQKWDEEIRKHASDRETWSLWKKNFLENVEKNDTIPYYGILDGKVICESIAVINPVKLQNSDGLVGKHMAYLCGFRTMKPFQKRGYFSTLMKFMSDNLRKKGFLRVTLAVEHSEKRNREIYAHYGFTERIKSEKETYPDGTVTEVEYYGKDLW
ncbi:MAG: GNAT family N-acetyltransferase [Lachnospiraceae bacterium]|nr:GNAT family N-acetyltransferase [Lachnospiraceae bacterium]